MSLSCPGFMDHTHWLGSGCGHLNNDNVYRVDVCLGLVDFSAMGS